MEEYEFRGGLIEYFMNMLLNFFRYMRLDLLYIRKVTEGGKIHTIKYLKRSKIDKDK